MPDNFPEEIATELLRTDYITSISHLPPKTPTRMIMFNFYCLVGD